MNALALFNSPSQWLILIIVCLVIFGAKRLPEIARSLGRSLGEFKKVRKEMEQELLEEEKRVAAPKPADDASRSRRRKRKRSKSFSFTARKKLPVGELFC